MSGRPRARLILMVAALAGVVVGCARAPTYASDESPIVQPTPNQTVDAIVRGIASPAVASPLPVGTLTPPPNLAANNQPPARAVIQPTAPARAAPARPAPAPAAPPAGAAQSKPQSVGPSQAAPAPTATPLAPTRVPTRPPATAAPTPMQPTAQAPAAQPTAAPKPAAPTPTRTR